MTGVVDADRDTSSGWAGLFGMRDFRRLWIGSALSALGSQLTMLALPLLVLDRTGSATAAGIVGTVRLLVHFATQLPAGVLADRSSRRAVLAVADGARAVALTALGMLVLTDTAGLIWWVAALIAVEGVFTAAANLAAVAAVPVLVPPPHRPAALALGQAQGWVIALAGPLLGAAMYTVHPALPFAVDGASYLVGLVLIVSVRRSLGGGGSPDGSMRRDLSAGLRFVLRSRYLLLMIGWSALMNFATAGLSFVLVIVIGTGGGNLGIAMAVIAGCGLFGAVLAPRFRNTDEDRLIRTCSAVIVLLGIVATLHPEPATMTGCAAGIALLTPVIVVPKNARLYALVPDDMMARVQAALFLIGGSLFPFATAVSGYLIETGSARLAAGTHTTVFTVVLVITLLPQLSRRAARDRRS